MGVARCFSAYLRKCVSLDHSLALLLGLVGLGERKSDYAVCSPFSLDLKVDGSFEVSRVSLSLCLPLTRSVPLSAGRDATEPNAELAAAVIQVRSRSCAPPPHDIAPRAPERLVYAGLQAVMLVWVEAEERDGVTTTFFD